MCIIIQVPNISKWKGRLPKYVYVTSNRRTTFCNQVYNTVKSYSIFLFQYSLSSGLFHCGCKFETVITKRHTIKKFQNCKCLHHAFVGFQKLPKVSRTVSKCKHWVCLSPAKGLLSKINFNNKTAHNLTYMSSWIFITLFVTTAHADEVREHVVEWFSAVWTVSKLVFESFLFQYLAGYQFWCEA